MPRLICFFVFILLCFNVSAGEFDSTLVKKGNLFFEKKDYYKAEIFFDGFLLENESCEVSLKTALCRYYTGRYEEALKLFSGISENCGEKYSIVSFYFVSEIYLEINEPGLYLSALSNLEKITEDQNIESRILNDRVWFYLRFLKTEKALEEIAGADEKTKSQFNFSKIENNIDILTREKKSPFLSGIYSIIPGGGYLYCGRYKDALFSFFINSILGASAYEAFDNDLNVAGVLLSALTLGFYSGNIYGGIRAANVENNIYRAGVYEELEKKFRVKDSYDFKLEFKIDF
jgi:tetratricopeptide (TPR) repeat protein